MPVIIIVTTITIIVIAATKVLELAHWGLVSFCDLNGRKEKKEKKKSMLEIVVS